MVTIIFRTDAINVKERSPCEAAALQPAEVQELFGEDFGFVIVTGRNHIMELCGVMPLSKGELLETVAYLAIAEVARRGTRSDDCIVFLPGIGESVQVQHRIKSVVQACNILILHRDCMDNNDE